MVCPRRVISTYKISVLHSSQDLGTHLDICAQIEAAWQNVVIQELHQVLLQAAAADRALRLHPERVARIGASERLRRLNTGECQLGV